MSEQLCSEAAKLWVHLRLKKKKKTLQTVTHLFFWSSPIFENLSSLWTRWWEPGKSSGLLWRERLWHKSVWMQSGVCCEAACRWLWWLTRCRMSAFMHLRYTHCVEAELISQQNNLVNSIFGCMFVSYIAVTIINHRNILVGGIMNRVVISQHS